MGLDCQFLSSKMVAGPGRWPWSQWHLQIWACVVAVAKSYNDPYWSIYNHLPSIHIHVPSTHIPFIFHSYSIHIPFAHIRTTWQNTTIFDVLSSHRTWPRVRYASGHGAPGPHGSQSMHGSQPGLFRGHGGWLSRPTGKIWKDLGRSGNGIKAMKLVMTGGLLVF